MTYSRGGLVALIPALALASARSSLKGIRSPLDQRTPDGIVLGMVMAGSLLGLLIAAWGLLHLEERAVWNDEKTRLVWRGLATTAGVLALLVVLMIGGSKGGPGSFADNAWHQFTKTSQDKDSDPARIVSSKPGHPWG